MPAVWAAPCIKLLQGALYEHDNNSDIWKLLIQYQQDISTYFEQIGIHLFLDTANGYAFLEQSEPEEGEPEIPRLIRRQPLSVKLSLLCILLREALENFDTSQNESPLCAMSEREIIDMFSAYFKERNDQKNLNRELRKYIDQAVDLGFLKELHQSCSTGSAPENETDRIFELRRILCAKISTSFIAEFKQRLEESHAT